MQGTHINIHTHTPTHAAPGAGEDEEFLAARGGLCWTHPSCSTGEQPARFLLSGPRLYRDQAPWVTGVHLTFKSKRHLSEEEGKQSGEKDEAEITKHFWLEPSAAAGGQGASGSTHGCRGRGGLVLAWLRVPNNKDNAGPGSGNSGAKERAIRKNIHLEFLLFFFLPLHCVTKYISARSHILVQ